jgi:hypothetical protein
MPVWALPRALPISTRCRLKRCVVKWYRNILSHVPSTRVREIASCSTRSTPARTSWRSPREGCPSGIEKLRGLRLSRAAELVEMAAEETLIHRGALEAYRTNNRSSASCARLGGARASLVHFRTGNPPSTWPRQCCATSPALRGRLNDI